MELKHNIKPEELISKIKSIVKNREIDLHQKYNQLHELLYDFEEYEHYEDYPEEIYDLSCLLVFDSEVLDINQLFKEISDLVSNL